MMLTVPPVAWLTSVIVSSCPASLAGPVKSLAVKAEKGMRISFVPKITRSSVSSFAVGASFTSVTVMTAATEPLTLVPVASREA
ncbi:hypothetical protein D3C76_1696390 [compost metagenome]